MTREEATERIKMILEEATTNEDAVSYVTSYDADALDMAIKALEQTEWIPVSERLPDKYGWYICSLKDGRVNCLYWNNQRAIWVDNVRKNMFELYTIRSKLTNKEISMEQEAVYWDGWVIAWMPLPEPYKAESEK